MIYNDFVRCAILEDKRNVFVKCGEVVSCLPEALRGFYCEFNPVDVEITLQSIGSVKLFPVSELSELQKDYELSPKCFVFATSDGDPIFLLEGKVYTSLPEVFNPELIADSFNKFLEMYVLQHV